MPSMQRDPATEHRSAHFGDSSWPRFCLLGVILISGCQPSSSPGGQHNEDEHHASHLILAHKPRTFPDAVRRLRELTTRLDDPATLPIATDIAKWLPEIAADSDMPESQWNLVSAQSALLAESLSKLATNGPKVETAPEPNSWSSSLSALEKQLAESNPKWFLQKPVNPDAK